MELAIFLSVYFLGYLICLPIAGWWFSKEQSLTNHDYESISGTMLLWPIFVMFLTMIFLVHYIGGALLWFSKHLIDIGRRFNREDKNG